MTVFKRADKEMIWHWMPQCLLYQALPGKAKRGQTITEVTEEEGWPDTVPGTYQLCPGCMALHLRQKTRDTALYIKRQVYYTGNVLSNAATYIANRWLP